MPPVGDPPLDFAAVVAAQRPGAQLVVVEPLTGGVSAQVYRLDLILPNGAAERVVLRMHGPTHGGHDADLEFRLLAAVADAGLPTARPLAVDTSRRCLPHPYLLLEHADGSAAFDPATAAERIPLMAETLATIHATPLAGFPELPVRRDPLPELLDYLPTGSADLKRRLRGLTDTAFEGADVLLHGDFWPANLLWRDDRIVAVLDWEDAAIGDSLSDVACAMLELRYLTGEAGAQQFREAYARFRPTPEQRLALWRIYVAAAAQRFMGAWGLPPEREAHMRWEALASIDEAVRRL
jgi:aminoglycoside phosphotransferase (APT) family kinase protein